MTLGAIMKLGLRIALAAGMFALAISGDVLADHNVRIGFYGDSTVYGSTLVDGEYPQSPSNEPEILQALLQARYRGNESSNVYVENHGVPGSVCSDFLWGQNKVKSDWKTEMATSPVDIVIMGTGINDAGRLSYNDLIFCYQHLSAIANQAGKIFIVETPNPVDYAWNSDLWSVVHVETYAASSTGALLIDQWNYIMASVPNWSSMLSDKIHPNDSLYSLKAAHTFKVIAPAVDVAMQKKQTGLKTRIP
ncbi:SGNH/GDSL hydrolase family protein [Luteibacter yeojuensis]|uniref:SGNH/GDSL hydrolase family protein n=1 Tax=Luteibacter yeojuensis TaxID=345309 RepID=A0A7X5QTX7_9GAMM|nr:SGNH/GDSL hydrolase family protein [Luteibacter yeojuensis]NID15370.1 SGNH/GDSL hydrolase family protein [Luteibacter yeojuensis]